MQKVRPLWDSNFLVKSAFRYRIKVMDFNKSITILNKLLDRKQPAEFNSSWILKYSPSVYRFIRANIRTDIGKIDWDKVTSALEWKFQRRWAPGRQRKNKTPYEDWTEVETILAKYRDKLYVFIALADINDRRIRDIICVSLVRIAQNGNLLAKQEVIKLVKYTIDDWIERYPVLFRWRGYKDKIQENLERCIRRYRYTGSFLLYVFKTLEYAGRGLMPLISLDAQLFDGKRRLIDLIGQDSRTGEVRLYRRGHC